MKRKKKKGELLPIKEFTKYSHNHRKTFYHPVSHQIFYEMEGNGSTHRLYANGQVYVDPSESAYPPPRGESYSARSAHKTVGIPCRQATSHLGLPVELRDAAGGHQNSLTILPDRQYFLLMSAFR